VNKTPLAETFRVWAVNSDLPIESTTGSARGKRTAQRTSWRGLGGAGTCDWALISDFIAFMVTTPTTMVSMATLANFSVSTHGTKVL
jgi:hypothetical protein